MRDLAAYEAEYTRPGFEDVQVRYRRKRVLAELEKAGARRVVEIGCGMEPLFLFYPSFEEYWFFEPGDVFFSNADRLARAAAPDRIHGYHLPFGFLEEVRDARPDFIVCSGMLHEVEKPEPILRDIRRTAGPDTLIHINVPNARSLHRRLAVAMGLIGDEHTFSDRNILLQQHRVFDEKSLAAMAEACGLKVVSRGGILVKPFTHAQMEQLMKEDFMTEQMLDGLSRLAEELPSLSSEIWINCRTA